LGLIVKGATGGILMNFEDVKKFLEENKGSEEVMSYVQGINPITLDKVKSFVQSDKDAKSWIDSEKDQYHNKAFKTWETNNLQKLIEDEVSKRNPQETPEQKKIRELEDRLNQKEKEETRQKLMNESLRIASDKKLPVDLIEHFIGSDDETTKANLLKLETVVNTIKQDFANESLKNGYKPAQNNNSNTTVNPWKKETWNLTNQGQILRDNPELAKQLKASAGVK